MENKCENKDGCLIGVLAGREELIIYRESEDKSFLYMPEIEFKYCPACGNEIEENKQ